MTALLITCEHASNAVPDEFAPLFADFQEILQTHQGIDIGTLPIFQRLIASIACHSVLAEWTRLLCDLNRSLNHPDCFSLVTRLLDQATKQSILTRFHQPYQQRVFSLVDSLIKRNLQNTPSVIHISVHSFTPNLNGEVRDADVAFLYDPARPEETRFISHWENALSKLAPDLRLRHNYPYRGTSNGLCQMLRMRHDYHRYVGIELEMNQAITCTLDGNQRMQTLVTQSLQTALAANQS